MFVCNYCKTEKTKEEMCVNKRYKSGHSNTLCKSCKTKQNNIYQINDVNHKEKIKILRKNRRKYLKENHPNLLKQKYRKRTLWNKFKITLEEYETIFKEQNKKCAICKNNPTNEFSLAVDHCHTTGKIRGLLCGKCNTSLGLLKESPKIIYEMINYIESFNEIK